MAAHPAHDPTTRLAPEVRGFAAGPFLLLDDLERLHRVQQAGAPEAAVFYCARVLEVLTADALRRVNLEASPNVFANLDTLQQFNLMQTPTLSWAHALRRLGNLVRHIQRRVRPEDAEVSALFVERCLEWFFCRFRYRPHGDLRRITVDEGPLALTAGTELRPLMVALDAGDFKRHKWGGAFLRAPALPATAAEMLLDRQVYDEARRLLEAALGESPDDLRLNQLMGLYFSRTGNLQEALRRLEPLHARFLDDGETAGITAGVYKRLWKSDKSDGEWLARSHRAYRHGWDVSRQSNAYLGVNAATTSLWMGRPEDARQIAAAVRRLLQRRGAALAKHTSDPDLALNYWDQVTLAEAQVLLGEYAAARAAYVEAFTKHPEYHDNIAVSRGQLGDLLQALGAACGAEEFLAGAPIPDAP